MTPGKVFARILLCGKSYNARALRLEPLDSSAACSRAEELEMSAPPLCSTKSVSHLDTVRLPLVMLLSSSILLGCCN